MTTLSQDTSTVIPSVITVVGTGDTPLASIQGLGYTTHQPRDIFFDAPLLELSEDKDHVYNSTISPLASVDFGSSVGLYWTIPALGRRIVRDLTRTAHAKGIQARFWNTPMTPRWARYVPKASCYFPLRASLNHSVRNFIWQMLMDEGADWLNVDALQEASEF